jgi:flagellar FliL protein
MVTEQRVVSDKKKIGAKSGSTSGGPVGEAPAKKGKKKRLVIIIALVVLAAAAGAYFFLLAPKASATPTSATPAPKPGKVLVIDSVSINLAGGHYLRLGMGLQLTADVSQDPDTARALDLAIELFSQRPIEQVSDQTSRDALKATLLSELETAYEGEVMGVYFTDFVTQ